MADPDQTVFSPKASDAYARAANILSRLIDEAELLDEFIRAALKQHFDPSNKGLVADFDRLISAMEYHSKTMKLFIKMMVVDEKVQEQCDDLARIIRDLTPESFKVARSTFGALRQKDKETRAQERLKDEFPFQQPVTASQSKPKPKSKTKRSARKEEA